MGVVVVGYYVDFDGFVLYVCVLVEVLGDSGFGREVLKIVLKCKLVVNLDFCLEC